MNICKEIGCTVNYVEDLENMPSLFKAGICSRPCDQDVVDANHSECCYICNNLTSECRIMCRESEIAILMKAVKIRKYMKEKTINANIS